MFLSDGSDRYDCTIMKLFVKLLQRQYQRIFLHISHVRLSFQRYHAEKNRRLMVVLVRERTYQSPRQFCPRGTVTARRRNETGNKKLKRKEKNKKEGKEKKEALDATVP